MKPQQKSLVKRKVSSLTSNQQSSESVEMMSPPIINKKMRTSFDGFLAGDTASKQQTASAAGVGRVVIRTYVPETGNDETRKRIFDITRKYYASNREAGIVLFGKDTIEPSQQILWPKCQVNNLFTQEEPGTSKTTTPSAAKKYESKFIGAFFKNPMSTSDSDLVAYYLYRENLADQLIEMTRPMLLDMVKKGKEYMKYLTSIDKTFIAVGEKLPDCPPMHILQEIEGNRRLIMQIDQPNITGRSVKDTRISPTISIRYMRLSGVPRNGSPPYWYHEKLGMSLSAANFFFMIESAIQNYLFRMEHTIKRFGNEYFTSEEKMEIYSKENLASWDSDFNGDGKYGLEDDDGVDDGDDAGYAAMID
jgi:hypothetical protein